VRLISCAFLALLLACGGEKPDDAATSWTATLQMTAEKWAANSVPARFVGATCDAAQKALKEASKQPSDDATRKKLDQALAAAGKLSDAAERGDRKAAQQIAEELRKQ
jgi:hypothetical protein